jgi:putative addiction module component (TIGR02574 family)
MIHGEAGRKVTKHQYGGVIMLVNLQTFEAEALTLRASERALLAQHLLASLDETDEQENEQLWLDEAQRRYNAYKNGTVSARDAFEAIAEMRGEL